MKKVLSVFLAVLMVFSFMAVSASAVESPYFGPGDAANDDQCVFMFRLSGGTCKSAQYVYDTTTGKSVYTSAEDVPQVFVVTPGEDDRLFLEGSAVTLPSVKAPKGQSFLGWQRVPSMGNDDDNRTYPAIPSGYKIKAVDIGRVVEFRAVYEAGEMEEDTFAKVFEILVKIFGTLIGLIAYQGNVEKGQDFMKKIFSSISD